VDQSIPKVAQIVKHPPKMDLKNKTIILTGAKRIGKTVARFLGERGANLAITYRSSKDEAEFMCNECIGAGSKAKAFQADLSSEVDILKLISAVKKEFGQIDGLVHMAANYPKTPIESVNMDQFVDTMKIIAGSTLLLGSKIGLEMQKNKGQAVLADGEVTGKIKGKMVFFSDWSILVSPYPDYIIYNGAKAAVDSMVKSFAKAFGPSITVNAIAPGPILRPPDLTEEEDKEALAGTPLQRWGGTEAVAQALITFMENDFLTGVILPVDGGRTVG